MQKRYVDTVDAKDNLNIRKGSKPACSRGCLLPISPCLLFPLISVVQVCTVCCFPWVQNQLASGLEERRNCPSCRAILRVCCPDRVGDNPSPSFRLLSSSNLKEDMCKASISSYTFVFLALIPKPVFWVIFKKKNKDLKNGQLASDD